MSAPFEGLTTQFPLSELQPATEKGIGGSARRRAMPGIAAAREMPAGPPPGDVITRAGVGLVLIGPPPG